MELIRYSESQNRCGATGVFLRGRIPIGVFAACSLLWNERCGENSLLGGELALPIPGGSRQPPDTQINTTTKHTGWQVDFGGIGLLVPGSPP
jgi:hypothetical protein